MKTLMKVISTICGILIFIVGVALTVLPHVTKADYTPAWVKVLFVGVGGLAIFPDVIARGAKIAHEFWKGEGA